MFQTLSGQLKVIQTGQDKTKSELCGIRTYLKKKFRRLKSKLSGISKEIQETRESISQLGDEGEKVETEMDNMKQHLEALKKWSCGT